MTTTNLTCLVATLALVAIRFCTAGPGARRSIVNADLPSMRAVGYRQLWRHLAGVVILDTAVREAVTATRQLAKRQRTWLRTEDEAICFDALEPGVATHILKTVSREIRV